MKPTRHRVLLALLTLPLAASLTACGGAASSDNAGGKTASSGTDQAANVPEPARQDGLVDYSSAGGGAAKEASSTVISRSVIATGQLRLSSPHLADARQDAINLATGMQGFVADEQSQSDAHGKLDRVDLTLRVPADSFEKALDGLAALGTVRHREQSVQDVTTQVIDNAARVRAQRASVESIERLLARATTIAEIMSIERQLADRQADLDSLEQQQKWLADQTSMSTIQVTLVEPAKAPKSDHEAGFLSGLSGGWHALGKTAVAVGTAVGAVLPFAAVLALVGVPVWVLLRRRRVVATPPPAPEV